MAIFHLPLIQDYVSVSDEIKYAPRTGNLPLRGLSSEKSQGFPTRSDTNWPVQSQKRARSLKFGI